MDLAIRDHKIMQFKAELENRKKLLCMKRRELKTNVRDNEFLRNVAEDYEKLSDIVEVFRLYSKSELKEELKLSQSKYKSFHTFKKWIHCLTLCPTRTMNG